MQASRAPLTEVKVSVSTGIPTTLNSIIKEKI